MRDHDRGGGIDSPTHATGIFVRLLRGARGRGGDANAAPRRSFLGRLARDARGNTLAIVGAALVPLAGMIGSGVDMSRAYMAKTRLQSACDAAALAGRRVMQNDTLNSTVTAEATRFFNFNFPQHLYNTPTFTPSVTRPTAGTVRVTASTTIPTSIMKIFGFTSLPLNVTCDASLNFVNTDIMLVLDTTGSMDNDINDNFTNTNSARKITALRDAVMALYTQLAPTQAQLTAAGMRLRYGIVPYSSTVNVGALLNASFIADSVTYQSRVANYNTLNSSSNANGPYYEYYTSTAPYHTVTMSQATSIPQANCTAFIKNQALSGYTFTSTPTSTGGPAPATTVTTTFPNDGTASSGVEWGWSGAPDTSGTNESCRRQRTDTTTTYNYLYTDDTYRPVIFDTSQFKLFNPVTLASADNGHTAAAGSYSAAALPALATGESDTTSTWNGCIEERQTVSTINTSTDLTIPAGATDLDINLIPNSPETKWRPMWSNVVHRRTAGSASATSGTSMAGAACPKAAARLTTWTSAAMQNYVNGLNPEGNTYHDIGMIWGARMLSSGGVFADSPDTFGGMPVSRHIIFMTDGQLAPACTSYTAYGVEQNDIRVTGAGSCPNQYERHLQRFKMVCNAAKSMNISIWVIAFGTSLSSDMQQCASNSNQASTAADRNALIARFQQIGSQIGALRLTQ
jgi:Flp pilus assembly protein TadG